MSLPPNCAACGFYKNHLCIRHAPAPGNEILSRAHWQKPMLRCGEGDTDGKPVQCQSCVHWYQPDGKPLTPPGLSRRSGYWSAPDSTTDLEWWKRSGYCTKNAPYPGSVPDMVSHPKVTHGTLEGCGDGQPVPPPT